MLVVVKFVEVELIELVVLSIELLVMDVGDVMESSVVVRGVNNSSSTIDFCEALSGRLGGVRIVVACSPAAIFFSAMRA